MLTAEPILLGVFFTIPLYLQVVLGSTPSRPGSVLPVGHDVLVAARGPPAAAGAIPRRIVIRLGDPGS